MYEAYKAIIIPKIIADMSTGSIGDLDFENWYKVDRDTICQCTGLKDKNGKLIWEKDVVRCEVGTAEVIWDKSGWRTKWLKNNLWRKDLHYWTVENSEGAEVIGNIFDNKELLESEEK